MIMVYKKSLRAIGATKNLQHSNKKTEYWNMQNVEEGEFYNIRTAIPFLNLLAGFRSAGLIVYLDKPNRD